MPTLNPLLAATMLKSENDRADAARPAQPSDSIKLLTLSGASTGWSYRFEPPPVCCTFWSNRDWINWIGDNWFKRSNNLVAPVAP